MTTQRRAPRGVSESPAGGHAKLPRTTAPAPCAVTLTRCLGPGRGLGLTLGVVIGSGIFVLPAQIARQLPDPASFTWIWIVGGLLSLASALSYAELATTFPETGGYVVYLRRIYGDRLAFAYGWAVMLVIYPSSIAGLARVFGTSAADLLGVQLPTAALACGAIALAASLNVLGVVLTARAQVGLSAAKVGALLLLAVAGVALAPVVASHGADPSGLPHAPVSATATGAVAGGLLPWLLAIVFMEWCYAGFLEVVVVAGEVERPARTLTVVLTSTVLLIMAIYVLYALALRRHLGMEAIAGSPAVAADLARALMGPAGGRLLSAVVTVATFGAMVSLLFSGPRILLALAGAGLFFPAAGRLWAPRRTPAVAVLLCAAAAAVYACVGSFEQLVQYFYFATGLFSAVILAGGMWLRARGRVAADSRRIPLWPLPPLLAVATALGGTAYVARSLPRASAIGLSILLLALPLSSVARRLNRAGS
jgi:APA family basic amino acid/polyamine antiporter